MGAQSIRWKTNRYSLLPNYGIELKAHNLVIQEDETIYAKGNRNMIFLLLVIFIPLSPLLLLNCMNTKVFAPLIGFVAIGIGCVSWYYYRYRHYNRVVQWNLDRTLGTATYQKIFPTFKELKQLKLSNIESVKCNFDYFFFKYRISFILTNNKRVLVIAGVKKEDYASFEMNLATFLNVPINHHKSFGTLAFNGIFILFIVGISCLFMQGTIFLGIVMIFFAILGGYLVIKKDL